MPSLIFQNIKNNCDFNLTLMCQISCTPLFIDVVLSLSIKLSWYTYYSQQYDIKIGATTNITIASSNLDYYCFQWCIVVWLQQDIALFDVKSHNNTQMNISIINYSYNETRLSHFKICSLHNGIATANSVVIRIIKKWGIETIREYVCIVLKLKLKLLWELLVPHSIHLTYVSSTVIAFGQLKLTSGIRKTGHLSFYTC